MGGRADATNVLADPLVSVLTRVAIDHEAYLGATLAEIAWHKAGIVKRGVPVVVDATNDQVVLDTVDAAAREAAAGEVVRAQEGAAAITCELGRIACAPALRGGYQRANAAVAAHALAVAARTFPQITAAAVAAGIAGAAWPGRLDVVDVSPLLAPRAASRPTEALLDGAHNPQAAAALAEYVDARRGGGSVNWVLAATQGKQLPAILAQLLRSGDGVFAVPFGPVDGMPWVQCVPPRDIARLAHNVLAALGGAGEVHPCASEVEGLQLATSMPPGRTVVVAGSL
ncbi:Mur ligase [Tirmania nivea]|nr:Mur ligase [Tirmania nivea]